MGQLHDQKEAKAEMHAARAMPLEFSDAGRRAAMQPCAALS
jgi:hypothetical protein